MDSGCAYPLYYRGNPLESSGILAETEPFADVHATRGIGKTERPLLAPSALS